MDRVYVQWSRYSLFSGHKQLCPCLYQSVGMIYRSGRVTESELSLCGGVAARKRFP